MKHAMIFGTEGPCLENNNLGFVGLIYIMLFPLRMVTVVILALVLVALVVILAICMVIQFFFKSRFLYLPGRFRNFIKFCRLTA
jgi:hypothetical protein